MGVNNQDLPANSKRAHRTHVYFAYAQVVGENETNERVTLARQGERLA